MMRWIGLAVFVAAIASATVGAYISGADGDLCERGPELGIPDAALVPFGCPHAVAFADDFIRLKPVAELDSDCGPILIAGRSLRIGTGKIQMLDAKDTGEGAKLCFCDGFVWRCMGGG